MVLKDGARAAPNQIDDSEQAAEDWNVKFKLPGLLGVYFLL